MSRCILLVAVLALVLASCKGGDDEKQSSGNQVVGRLDPVALNDGAVGLSYLSSLSYVGILNPAFTTTWSITSGALPPGLTLQQNPTAATQMHGTPSSAGNFTFTVEYLSSDGSLDYVASRAYTITIHPAGELFIETGNLPDAGTNPYSRTLTARGGTGVGYTWSIVLGALPPGLALGGNNVTLTWSAFMQTGAITQAATPRLSEVSGICASRSQPGVFWVHDDSGNAASIYAIDAAGALLQRYDLATTNTDWEDICLGPGPGGDCLYVGDVGDNLSMRSDCHLLRVAEPVVPATPQAPIALTFESFYFSYPGGAQNCESLLIDWDSGTPYLVEKTGGSVRVHKFPMPLNTAWTAGSPTTLLPVTATITGIR